jgi:transposase-like protein
MARYIPPEKRAQIVSAVKDDGMPIVDAAKTYSITEEMVRKWMRKQCPNASTSVSEVQRLRQEVLALRAIIGKMVHLRESKRRGQPGH